MAEGFTAEPSQRNISRSKCMDSEHKRSLKKGRVEIMEDMEPSIVVDHLVADDVVTSYEEEKIHAETTSQTKSRYLLRIIEKKCDAGFNSFVKALKETGQAHIASYLEKCSDDACQTCSGELKLETDEQMAQSTSNIGDEENFKEQYLLAQRKLSEMEAENKQLKAQAGRSRAQNHILAKKVENLESEIQDLISMSPTANKTKTKTLEISLGVGIAGFGVDKVLGRGINLPASRSIECYAMIPELPIIIYAGERPMKQHNVRLTRLDLKKTAQLSVRKWHYSLRFNVDVRNILTVTASGEQIQVETQAKVDIMKVLDAQIIERLVVEAEIYINEDTQERERAQCWRGFSAYVDENLHNLQYGGISDTLSPRQKDDLGSQSSEVKVWLQVNMASDKESILRKRNDFEALINAAYRWKIG